MSRVKLTEFKAKQLLYQALNLPYRGVSATIDNKGLVAYSTPLSELLSDVQYVVKVDQGVKGRMKKGLVILQVTSFKLQDTIKKLAVTGYTRFIIEEMVEHDQKDERYMSIERVRTGLLVQYSNVGGIEIEKMMDRVKQKLVPYGSIDLLQEREEVAKELGIEIEVLVRIREFCEKYYVSFIEINPLVVDGSKVHILDLAVEVDSTGQFFVKDGWTDSDIVGDQQKSDEEIAIKNLNDRSQAALSFTLLNPDGAIWVLLSGGGASITLADEFYNLGFGKELGNYGEYSGNPNAEETYLYTRDFLKAMFASKSKNKIILIGGGVANFTDIRVTFSGILRAFEEVKEVMKKHKTKVYVRRGGPKEHEGLEMMKKWLQKNEMYGYVAGPEMPLHEIVRRVVDLYS